jgi:hypothetical protein
VRAEKVSILAGCAALASLCDCPGVSAGRWLEHDRGPGRGVERGGLRMERQEADPRSHYLQRMGEKIGKRRSLPRSGRTHFSGPGDIDKGY